MAARSEVPEDTLRMVGAESLFLASSGDDLRSEDRVARGTTEGGVEILFGRNSKGLWLTPGVMKSFSRSSGGVTSLVLAGPGSIPILSRAARDIRGSMEALTCVEGTRRARNELDAVEEVTEGPLATDDVIDTRRANLGGKSSSCSPSKSSRISSSSPSSPSNSSWEPISDTAFRRSEETGARKTGFVWGDGKGEGGT